MNTEDFKEKIYKGQAKKTLLTDQLCTAKEKAEKARRALLKTEKAQVVIQTVAQLTQEKVKVHIEDIVNLAMDSVFPDPYEVELDFVIRRNKTECDIWFIRNGNRVKPLEGSGGGAVDIASFALRVALWNLQKGDKANTIILDEPFRFLSRDLQEKGAVMLKTLSEKLDLQFIMVSHNQDLIDYSDKTFLVTQKKGISRVEEVN